MDDGEFHLWDLVARSDDSYKCLRCGIIFIGTNPEHVREHYTTIHKRLFRLPPEQQKLVDIRENMSKKKRLTKSQKKALVQQDQQKIKDIPLATIKKKMKQANKGAKKKIVDWRLKKKKKNSVPKNSDPGDNSFQRPVPEMFHVLQATFELLRPNTQQKVMKQLTNAVIDAYYGDQQNNEVVPT